MGKNPNQFSFQKKTKKRVGGRIVDAHQLLVPWKEAQVRDRLLGEGPCMARAANTFVCLSIKPLPIQREIQLLLKYHISEVR